MPKVTVCVVCYNQEHYIYDCLISIVEQKTNFEFEVLVADDGSNDGTQAVILDFAEKYPIVKPILRGKNIGASENYFDVHNQAALRSEYVCHCDGDDRWLPGKLQKQADFLDKSLEYAVVWTNVNFFNDVKGVYLCGQKFNIFYMFPDGEVELGAIIRFGSPTHSTLMYRSVNRKILPNYPFELDFFYTIEYLRQGKGKIISDVLAEYRANSSTSISVSGFKMCQKLRIEYYKNLLKEDFTRWKNDVFVCAAYKFLSYIRNPNRIAWDWLKLAFLSFTFNGLYSFLEYYQQIKTQAKRFKCI